MNYKIVEKRVFSLLLIIPVACLFSMPVSAMHIMEGYLPIVHCIVWGAASLPFIWLGLASINRFLQQHRKAILLLAMVGAYSFVLSALKIPSVTGSSSHPTGTGLGAILFGATPMAVVSLIVLLFQAIMIAHGGLTTLGANVFSMGIAGPFATWGIYSLMTKLKLNRSLSVAVACAMGNLITYCVTAVQLGIAHPSDVGGASASIIKFLGVFAVTQVPLAIVEGIISAIVIIMLESFAKPELKEIGFLKGAEVL